MANPQGVKVGSIVRVRSGRQMMGPPEGPEMQVESIEGEIANCSWKDAVDPSGSRRGNYPVSVLALIR